MSLKSSKRSQIPSFIVMDVMKAADDCEKRGKNIIHLEVGQPSTSAPEPVITSLKNAFRTEKLGYTLALGHPKLRERISQHYQECYGCFVDPDRIAITAGSSGAFVLSFLTAFDLGDRVAMASPSYPAYRNILAAFGVEVINIQTSTETNFQPTPELLDDAVTKHGQLHGLIIASPANPTGTMLSADQLENLVSYCAEKKIRLISDEIYHGITYGRDAETAIKYSEDVFVINSFSKYFSMTGWRLGWMIVPPDLIREIECVSQNLFISPSALAQVGGLAAFDCHSELKNNVSLYAKNRTLLLNELPKLGFSEIANAEGAFYLYANVEHLTTDSINLCHRFLMEAGVAVTPGTDFDPIRGKFYVRLSFSSSHSEVEEGVLRLVDWCKGQNIGVK